MAHALILAFICGASLYFVTYLMSTNVILSFLASFAGLCVVYYFSFSGQAAAISVGDVADNFTTAIIKICFVSIWLFGTAVMFRLMDGPIDFSRVGSR